MSDPLFATNRAALLTAIRLATAQTAGSAQGVIDAAINKARLAFYRRLGIPRVTAILAMAVTAAPTTTDELVRFQAQETEAALVRCELLASLPILFGDSSADAGDAFQGEEAYTKQDGRLEEELQRCAAYIESSWDILDGSVDMGEDGGPDGLNSFVTEWDGTVPGGVRHQGNRPWIGGPLQKPDTSVINNPTNLS